MAKKQIKHALRELKDRIRGGAKTGPFDRVRSRRIFDLADARRAIHDERDPDARAFLSFAFARAARSESQIFQDLFAAYVLAEKKGGFFCDFGATNGVDLSNSYMLEKYYGWHGICAEPARNWHPALKANRPGAKIETDCVWSATGESLTFSESRYKELSTLTDFSDADGHARRRKGSEQYEVTTISLNDLLEKHGAPEGIDYLSIDTEGSELAILSAFDIAKWQPQVITVEHNYTPNRIAIHDLLAGAGYTRVLTDISCFDDWYLAPGQSLPPSRD